MAVWLTPSIVCRIEAVTRWRESPGTGEYNAAYTSDYKLRGGFEKANARAALNLLKLLGLGSSVRECGKEIGRVKVMTAAKNLNAKDLRLQIVIMAEELSVYPLDVVRAACRTWADTETFFPTWAELRTLCEEHVLFRRALARELRRHLDAIEKRPAQEAAPAKVPPACAVWLDNLAALEASPGWPILQRCIPDSDDGVTLTLAVEAPGLGFAVLAWAAQQVGPVVGRNIACIVKAWVMPALFECKIQISGAPSTEPHRRDGEIVTLVNGGVKTGHVAA